MVGLWASLSSRATAYSAKEPGAIPNTSSPTANRVTAEPVSTTVPATSRPSTGFRGPRSPTNEPHQVGLAGHQVPGAPVEAGGGHLDEHLVVTHGRAGDVGETQDVGVAVAVLDDRLHGGAPCSWSGGRCCSWWA